MTDPTPPGLSQLAGIRIVDFTQALSGPYCTVMLADLGADVIKIENQVRGDDSRHWGPPFIGVDAAYFMSVNRNKRSVAVDLKDPVDLAAVCSSGGTGRPGQLPGSEYGASGCDPGLESSVRIRWALRRVGCVRSGRRTKP